MKTAFPDKVGDKILAHVWEDGKPHCWTLSYTLTEKNLLIDTSILPKGTTKMTYAQACAVFERACRALSELLTLELRPAGEGFAVYSVLVPSPSAIRVARRTR